MTVGNSMEGTIAIVQPTGYKCMNQFLSMFASKVFSYMLGIIQIKECTAVLCKSNANDNRRMSCFVLTIYHLYISETSHGLPNIETINQRDIGTIFAITRRDIVLATLRCHDILQSKRYIVAAKFVVTICRSELRFNDLL